MRSDIAYLLKIEIVCFICAAAQQRKMTGNKPAILVACLWACMNQDRSGAERTKPNRHLQRVRDEAKPTRNELPGGEECWSATHAATYLYNNNR
jgi:hypothetical protein